MIRIRGKMPFVSLKYKEFISIAIALLMVGVMFLACAWVKSTVADYKYLNESAQKRIIDESFSDLNKYIKDNSVKATDSKAISAWLKTRTNTYLFIYDNFENIFEAGWWTDETTADLEDNLFENGPESFVTEPYNDGARISDDFAESLYDRVIQFSDGKYYVTIKNYSEEKWYEIMNIITACLCVIVFVIFIMIYNKRLIRRMIDLAEKVEMVGNGKLNEPIIPKYNDEIGILATSVDHMRTSIIERLENEKSAWEANTELIRSMSHDIRTPLTSLIGYLDIIQGGRYSTEDELEKYIYSCRDKAFQLKDLSDKLFQYFLVFGNPDIDRELESYDADILLQQLLSAHNAELINQGYRVNFSFDVLNGELLTDISAMRRLFDNVYSNIMKYADQESPIEVRVTAKNGNIVILVENKITEEAKLVESTRIGLKTCVKICTDLNGEFEYKETDKRFNVRIAFPKRDKEPFESV